jgi:hypothetical protein
MAVHEKHLEMLIETVLRVIAQLPFLAESDLYSKSYEA